MLVSYRGGAGAQLAEYRILADDIYLVCARTRARILRTDWPAGAEGAPAVNRIRSGSARNPRWPPMPTKPLNLRKGDLYRHVMAGGGGFGNPLGRDVERVRAGRVIDGKVTPERCRAAYGVVISNDAEKRVDESATHALRAERVARAN